MWIKRRSVRGSERFRPRYVRWGRREREVLVSEATVSVVLLFLGGALVTLAWRVWVLLGRTAGPTPWPWRAILPALLFFAGLFVLRSGWRKIREVRERWPRRPSDPVA
jgi:hypothetical protein